MAIAPEPPTSTRTPEDRLWLVALGGLVLFSIAIRLVVNTRFAAPTILTDELTYSQLARNIASGEFSLANGYGVVYPLLMAPSWALADAGTTAYTLMKATNAIVISLTAIPVFLWGRRLMRPRFALLAAALTLLMPAMAYSGHIMTENAFVLAVVLAAWAMAATVERPTLLRQGLLLAAFALAFATRAQAGVLVVALPLVVVASAALEAHAASGARLATFARTLAHWWPLVALAASGLAIALARTLLSGWDWSRLLQAYGATADGQYTVGKVARYFVWHLGEASFALGVVPLAALGALVGIALLGRSRTVAERSFVVTGAIVIALVLLQVAVFTSYWSERVSERNMFCIFPLALIALCLWLDRGPVRPTRVTAVAAAVAGGAVLCVPFAYLYQRAPSTETWGVVLPHILSRRLPGGSDDVQILIVAGVACALALFGILRPRVAVVAIPVVLFAYFAVAQVAVIREVGRTARDFRAAPGVGMDASWIERAAGTAQPVTLILGSPLGPDTDRLIAWQLSFFNRTPFEVRTWGADVTADPVTGAVTGAPLQPLVVTPASHQFAGETVEEQTGWLLQRPAAPAQLAVLTSGLFPDGWAAENATVDVYASPQPGAEVRVQAERVFAGVPVPGTTTVTTGPLVALAEGGVGIETATGSAVLETPSGPREVTVAQPPSVPFRIQLASTPPIIPTDFGATDPRALGARVSILIGETPIRD